MLPATHGTPRVINSLVVLLLMDSFHPMINRGRDLGHRLLSKRPYLGVPQCAIQGFDTADTASYTTGIFAPNTRNTLHINLFNFYL